MLGCAPPPSQCCRVENTSRAWPLFCHKALWAFQRGDLSVLTRDFLVSFCLRYAVSTTAPFPQIRKILPRHKGMGPGLGSGSGLESWLMNLFLVLGVFQELDVSHLGSFSQGR